MDEASPIFQMQTRARAGIAVPSRQKLQTDLENEYDYIISTDGSTLKGENNSLGPSAAAAVVFTKEQMREPSMVYTISLGHLSNNYEF